MQEARGRIALFTDADLSAPIEEAEKLIGALQNNDVAIGSRAVDRSLITVSWHETAFANLRALFSTRSFDINLWLPFVDTQCGFKAFRREKCAIVFEQQRIERFGFDPEFAVPGAPCTACARWRFPCAGDIQPRQSKHAARQRSMFIDVLVIRWNALTGALPAQEVVSPCPYFMT